MQSVKAKKEATTSLWFLYMPILFGMLYGGFTFCNRTFSGEARSWATVVVGVMAFVSAVAVTNLIALFWKRD